MPRPTINGHRHHVILTGPQHQSLTKLAKTTGLTTSELHRRAIDMLLTANREKRAGLP